MINQPWYVYIVQATDGSLYTGITTNIEKRVSQHNNGRGAQSLKGKRPVKLVYFETFTTGTEARRREYAVKQWKRANKVKLILKNPKNFAPGA